jgi:5-formyltetrahydrofolate cyclo-ligase
MRRLASCDYDAPPASGAYTLASFVSSIDPSGPRAKPSVRQAALSRRDEMPEAARRTASVEIARGALALITERGSALTVALYAAKGSEVDTGELATALTGAGHHVVYPRVDRLARVLEFHVASASELTPGRFGLREPTASLPRAALDAIDVFIVPGLAFDRTGGRIGWGRGHYDATLAAAPNALRVGVAFARQLVEQVPHDVHDIRLHAVVTELATHRMTS